MNTLRYNNTIFEDATIISGNIIKQKSPITDELSYDTLDVSVVDRSGEIEYLYDSLGSALYDSIGSALYYEYDEEPLIPFARGSAGELYHNDALIGKFYISSIDRNTKINYTLHFVSALGILDRIPCYGGMYTREPAKNIIAYILGGTKQSETTDYEYYTGTTPFYLEKRLGEIPITGWLPYSKSSRDSLQQVLFAVGGSVLKNESGVMKIAFWQPTEGVQISSDRLFIDGTVTYNAKATNVSITEHSFEITTLDKESELFNSNDVAVDHKLILFNNPMHDLTATGLTINESGSNYAIVSGTGSLTGYEYTHTTTNISKETGAEGDEKTVSVSDAYLVSTLNSINVMERVSAYYGYADIINYGFVVQGDVQEGDRVKFTDPFGEQTTAYLSSEDITLSGILKASATFITNWQPNHIGNAYNNYTLLSSGTTWNVPSNLQGTPARIVVFGGFEGGQGGYNGANGGTSTWSGDRCWGVDGGAGGNAGTGGSKVNIVSFDILSLGSSYSYTLGTGGAGGSANGGSGSLGTDSTFNGISSSTGTQNTIGWANPIDGTIYGGKADDGVKGGNGGTSGSLWIMANAEINTKATNGGDVGSFTGGEGTNNFISGDRLEGKTGGGGGGASVDCDGYDATESQYLIGGNGGNGASVLTVFQQASLGQNGQGGSGGGGGGSAGSSGGPLTPEEKGYRGSGGTGQAGQQGSNGFIIVMHN